MGCLFDEHEVVLGSFAFGHIFSTPSIAGATSTGGACQRAPRPRSLLGTSGTLHVKKLKSVEHGGGHKEKVTRRRGRHKRRQTRHVHRLSVGLSAVGLLELLYFDISLDSAKVKVRRARRPARREGNSGKLPANAPSTAAFAPSLGL